MAFYHAYYEEDTTCAVLLLQEIIGPSMLGQNSKYVFALPPRYNYAFPTGFEEVEKILETGPLTPIEEIH